jgi:hypothetical protein
MRDYRFNSIGSLFLENVKTKELNKEVKFGFSKTLHIAISDHLIYLAIMYLNVLILKALIHKMATNIDMF